MGVKSLLVCDDEKVCNRRTESLQVTKMIGRKPTNSRLLLSAGTTQKPVHHQQFMAPNAIISLLFILLALLRTSSALSVQISDGGVDDMTTGDGQTPRVQWSASSGSPPIARILSRGNKEEGVSLSDDEMTQYSQESTSPAGKRDDLISRTRSPSRQLLMMTHMARAYKFTASAAAAAASNSGPDELNALLAIKKSFVDDHGVLASWTSNSGNKNKNNSSFRHCRTWVGVTCNSLQQVVGIDLAGGWLGVLGGTISAVFGSLKQLVVLDLSSNALEGGIPSELGGLPRLQELRLSGNSLNGKNGRPLKLSDECWWMLSGCLCVGLLYIQVCPWCRGVRGTH